MASSATTHAKAVNTEDRLNALVPQVGALKSAQGTFGGFSGANQSVALQNSETGSPQVTGTVVYTSGAQQFTGSGPSAHTHSYGHFHFTQLETDFNKLQASFADVCSRLIAMEAALQSAGIL
jgi:hypothetical protein